MSIKESALTAITSIAQSDFIRAVTSAGASRRITLANLAKAIVESYTGSSLAGSSQSVKSAIDSLNSKTKLNEIYGTGSDLNDAERFTWYYVFTSAAHCPEQGILFSYGETNNYTQVLFGYQNVYVRRYYQGSFSTWYKCSGVSTA